MSSNPEDLSPVGSTVLTLTKASFFWPSVKMVTGYGVVLLFVVTLSSIPGLCSQQTVM